MPDDTPRPGRSATIRSTTASHATPEFAQLRSRYRGFVIPATVAFLAWYLLYVVMSNWASGFMNTQVIGHINVALIFGLLQFVDHLRAGATTTAASPTPSSTRSRAASNRPTATRSAPTESEARHERPDPHHRSCSSRVVALTIGITFWASRDTKTAADFYSGGRSFSGFQNGLAIGGDYMSAASFLGISGAIALYGYDGFLYSIGFLVAWLVALLLVAEMLRNAGRYTMADQLAFRMNQRQVRTAASTLDRRRLDLLPARPDGRRRHARRTAARRRQPGDQEPHHRRRRSC